MIDRNRIQQQLSQCLTGTDFTQLGKKYTGKVRDTYDRGDQLVIITTDRQSAFDRVLAAIPFKGQVLTQVSQYWFEHTSDIIANHLIAVPDPNVMIVKKCTVFPVEFVVRGYLSGVTSTSAWTAYQAGERNFCGTVLSDGLIKNQPFVRPIITPTTKSDQHDEKIAPAEIINRQLMTATDWEYCAAVALQLFQRGQTIAQQHGLILVDTKYEFGKLADGTILLVDEVHTPDSSRYWLAGTYAEHLANGQEPDNIDKEFLRLWFMEHCDPYHDAVLPPAPTELVVELSSRYIQLFETITGQAFQYPTNHNIIDRMQSHL
ncbi:MAG: phosphoribosylaminoimidazolesuccinocarboxamide synthase [Candidatus Kerfeldbacteria bacterium]|nr:phosphoribosylaminoimidazolesuccinocarboxamide synthase [Candidatus Kerfeldbacteria bacterium]